MRAQLIVIRVNKERTEILSESTRGNSDVRFLILTTMNSSHPPLFRGGIPWLLRVWTLANPAELLAQLGGATVASLFVVARTFTICR